MAFLPKILKFAAEDQLRLRWYLRYEEAYPHFEDFKAALLPAAPASKEKVESIVADSLKLLNLDWRAENG